MKLFSLGLILLLSLGACRDDSGPSPDVTAKVPYRIGYVWTYEFKAHDGKLLCVSGARSLSCVANFVPNKEGETHD